MSAMNRWFQVEAVFLRGLHLLKAAVSDTADNAVEYSRDCPRCVDSIAQFFLLSILRFRTMSLRLSKLETVRVVDLAPSFSACNS